MVKPEKLTCALLRADRGKLQVAEQKLSCPVTWMDGFSLKQKFEG